MTRSITQNTQRVFDDANTPFANELGKNTPNGLKNGALVATIGAIDPYSTADASLRSDLVASGSILIQEKWHVFFAT